MATSKHRSPWRRLERLERASAPELPAGWCCVRRAGEDDVDGLPPRCPHGRRWLIILADNEASRRYLAATGGAGAYRFTIRIDQCVVPGASAACAAPGSMTAIRGRLL